MPELAGTGTASRSAFLELRDEQRLVNDGYEFLDEKRILLAAELLRQRDAWRVANAAFMARWREAAQALPAAAADQGLDGLLVHPRYSLDAARLEVAERPYVGQVMLEAGMHLGDTALAREPVRPSPRTLEESMGIGWEILGLLAESELTRLSNEQITHYIKRRKSDA